MRPPARRLVRSVLCAALLLALTGSAAHAAGPPNIVVILTDDNPALDGRLVDFMPATKAIFKDQGITFTDFHGESPLCCPGRAGFLTGQHTHNHGVTRNSASLFNPAMTIATQLDGLGYRTAMIGKYFNQYSAIAPSVPPGWDHFVAFHDEKYFNYDLWIDGGSVPEHHGSAPEDYSTDVLSRKAVDFITGTPSGQPLFLWLATNSPHSPTNDVAPRYVNAPCSPPLWSPPNYNEADVSDKPAYIRQKGRLSSSGKDLTTICRNLLAVDDLVAAVRDSLGATGRLDDTVIIFTGDNGMNMGAHRLNSGKASPYVTEVPFYLSWPARLGTQPRATLERLQNIDLAPTLCELAGCSLGPYPNGQTTPDGVSFAALLYGTATTVGRDAVLDEMLVAFSPVNHLWWAVTTTPLSALGRWHYIEYDTGEKELYDVSNGPCWTWILGQPGDPCELENRVNDPAYAPIVQALHDRLVQLEAEKGHGGNTAPTCTGTTLVTTQDTPGDAAPVCSDPDPGTALVYSIASQGTKGTASVVGGQLHYVPNPGETGPDSFTYQASDGELSSNAATVSVTITPPGGTFTATLLATGDGTRDAVVKTQSGGTTNLYAAIDEAVSGSDNGTTYIRNDNKRSGSYFALLADLPANFLAMTGLSIDIRARTTGRVDDSTTLYARVYAADEVTPLTDEVAVAVNPGTSGWTTVSGISVSSVAPGSKATWDGARLRLRWAYGQVGTADTTQLRLTAVEVDATYTGS